MKKMLTFVFILLAASLMADTSIDWGNLQWPNSMQVVVDQASENVYGQVYKDGVTNGTDQGAGITAQVGYGAVDSTPDGTWTWFDTTYNTSSGNNDEYVGTITPTATGSYHYTYRYMYEGDTDYYYPTERGTMTVIADQPDPVSITFRVNMRYETVSDMGIHIAGSFQEWNPGSTEMTDIDEDLVYEYTIGLVPGTDQQYKFVNGNSWDGAEDDPNRQLTVPDIDTVLDIVNFNDFDPNQLTQQDVTVTFNVDMQYIDDADTVSVAGTFNSWNSTANLLSDDDEDGVYTAAIVIPSGSVRSQTYKFVNNGTFELDGQENRTFIIDDTVTEQTLDTVLFDNYDPGNYLQAELTVTFSCNVSAAIENGLEFNTLSICGSQAPLDWDFTANNHQLFSMGDNWWNTIIVFPAGTYRFLQFKFARNGADNEADFGQNHEVWLQAEGGQQLLENNFGEMGLMDDNDLTAAPAKMQLSNYPNPFNPNTTIALNIPTTGVGSVNVYNLKGQKVTNLYKGKLSAGSHKFTWQGTDQQSRAVSSGIYFVVAKSGRYTSTKKMILLK